MTDGLGLLVVLDRLGRALEETEAGIEHLTQELAKRDARIAEMEADRGTA